MPKIFTKRLFNQRGITLIELIAVILIIGIIAAVGVPVVFNQVSKADHAALVANVDVVNGAIERYALLEDGYPVVAVSESEDAKVKNAEEIASLITLLVDAANNTEAGPYLKSGFTFGDKVDYAKLSVHRYSNDNTRVDGLNLAD